MFTDFKWTVETDHKIKDGVIEILAPGQTDYFVNPIDDSVKANAPFFYKEVEGDFILRARVSLDFVSTYDACVLLALENDKLWAKACFEYTDLGTNSVVTVMTNGKSDDANGVDVEGNEIWLQMSRQDNIFAIHYSLDGDKFLMSRLSHLPMGRKIKVGLEAQSPTGNGGIRKFSNITLEERSPLNIREGV
ncbi:MAG TPA: DUF1349 domain-containing protein [Bacillota bacterium]|nr:DUF1349 domain-containing protein [Bacillota bacterium]